MIRRLQSRSDPKEAGLFAARREPAAHRRRQCAAAPAKGSAKARLLVRGGFHSALLALCLLAGCGDEAAAPTADALADPRRPNYPHLVRLTERNFDRVLEREDRPVLIEFWASWCEPCLHLAPRLDEFAAQNAERIVVGRVNIDEERALADRFSVKTPPVHLLFESGKFVRRVENLESAEELEREVFRPRVNDVPNPD